MIRVKNQEPGINRKGEIKHVIAINDQFDFLVLGNGLFLKFYLNPGSCSLALVAPKAIFQ